MESSSVNGMCRCCASEGAFKDIKTSYHWMGEEEVYSDMLRECFDVNLASADQGGICEVCITQLRNASNFKKQVLHTEGQFKQHLRSKGFKAQVKEEMSGFDDNDSDDGDMDNGDDEDYVPDYGVSIKTESESEEKPKKRGAAKAVNTRAKKSKSSDDGAVKSKHQTYEEAKSSAVRKQTEHNRIKGTFKHTNEDADLPKHLHNLKEILLSTNATPIRNSNDKGYTCSFCNKQYTDPVDLKIHSLEEHDDETKQNFMNNINIRDFLVKLDISCLECNLCGVSLDNYEELVDHLEIHGKLIFRDIKQYILPIVFNGNYLKCCVCNTEFTNLKTLQIHLHSHYKNFECNICGACFLNRKAIDSHFNYTHRTGTYLCAFCPKIFETNSMRKTHETSSHTESRLHKCGYCDERFKTFDRKRIHLANEHGVRKPLFQCKVCSKSFWKSSMLSNHVKKEHLMEKRFKCSLCDMGFFFQYLLTDHLISHRNVKEFKCEVCDKNFARMKALKEHVKIHAGERKHRCVYCDMSFVQKISLKRHIRSKHSDMEMYE